MIRCFQAALNSTPSVAACGVYGSQDSKLWALSQIESLHLWEWAAAVDEEVPGEHPPSYLNASFMQYQGACTAMFGMVDGSHHPSHLINSCLSVVYPQTCLSHRVRVQVAESYNPCATVPHVM